MNNEFKYNDGGEEKLREIFSTSEFEEDTTWRKYVNNWSIYYHLSPNRKNLLRWIDFDKESISILELGAGCGAITSYLTSLKNKPKVVAVEGSSVRADLIRLRCNKADNLTVHTQTIQDYEDSEKYDFVSLIGVLEYSGVYVKGTSPFLNILKKAVSFLKPEGVLLLAIENQFGHKYFAGHNEDHYGIPFEGISDYPNYKGIRTFGKKELQTMLKEVGLSKQYWTYPFPDYKMPNTILTDKSFNTASFDWLSLLNLPTTDSNSSNKLAFDERAFLKKMSKNLDISYFMNSFLVCASKSDLNEIFQLQTLANHLQFSHGNKFQNIKEFTQTNQNGIIVNQKKFHDGECISVDSVEYYSDYDNLLLLVVDNWKQKKYDIVAKYLLLWLDILRKFVLDSKSRDICYNFEKFCFSHLEQKIYENELEWLPAQNLDLILRNCLVNDQKNDVKIIDQEWNVGVDIPLKLVVDRGMYYLILKINQMVGLKDVVKKGCWNMPDALKNQLPELIYKPNLKSTLRFDCWFQKGVRNGSFTHKLYKVDLKKIKVNNSFHLKDKFFNFGKILLKKLGLKDIVKLIYLKFK